MLDKFSSNEPLNKDTINNINETYEYIKGICKQHTDQEAISREPIPKLAYSHVNKHLLDGTKFFLDDLKLQQKVVTSKKFYKNLPTLLNRLENGIPPNAIEKSIDDRQPVDLAEIINAAWFHKISWQLPIFTDGKLNEEVYKLRNRMNNLTLKAIEYSHVEKTNQYKKVGIE